MSTFAFRVTEDHMTHGFSRFRSAKRVSLFLWPVKALCFLGLGALILLSLVNKLWVPLAILSPFGVLLALGPRLDYWFFKRRLRKSPFYLSDVEIAISQEGCLSTDSKSRVELKWSVFTGAVRFADGFLLLIGPQQFYWWPNAALIQGSASDVNDLLRHCISNYRDA